MACGSRNLANDDGIISCTNCGMVQLEATMSAHVAVTELAGRAASASDHNPVDYLKLVEIGTPHDMVSKGNLGLAMELCNPRGKDFEGRKLTPNLLTHPYVSGQVLGKNAYVVEIPALDVQFDCGHIVQLVDSEIARFDPESACTKCSKGKKVVDTYSYKIPKAKRNFRDDTIYRKGKDKAHQLATMLKMDEVTRRYFGIEFNKVYDEFVGKTDFLALLALMRLQMTCPGLDVKMSADLKLQYGKYIEAMREFIVGPAEKAQLVTA
jgi:hypothetical protein